MNELSNEKNKELIQKKVNNFILLTIQEISKILNIQNPDEQEDLYEALEGFICKTNYEKLFSSIEEEKLDNELYNKMILHSFIKPIHLGIKIDIKEKNDYFKEIFEKIISSKSPRDKLNWLVNFAKLVSGLINFDIENKEKEKGADDFLPIFVFYIIKFCNKKLFSNFNFIKKFRIEDFISGISDYYLSTLESSIEFIINLNEKNLEISSEEYNENIKQTCNILNPKFLFKDIEKNLKFNDFNIKEIKLNEVKELYKEYQFILENYKKLSNQYEKII